MKTAVEAQQIAAQNGLAVEFDSGRPCARGEVSRSFDEAVAALSALRARGYAPDWRSEERGAVRVRGEDAMNGEPYDVSCEIRPGMKARYVCADGRILDAVIFEYCEERQVWRLLLKRGDGLAVASYVYPLYDEGGSTGTWHWPEDERGS